MNTMLKAGAASLIPPDPLTRRLLAKVLAAMIKDDFERARALRTNTEAEQVGAGQRQEVRDERV